MSAKTGGSPYLTTMTINGLFGRYKDITRGMSDEEIKKFVATKTKRDVASCYSIGKKGLKDIEMWLADSGLTFSDYKPANQDKKISDNGMTLRYYFAAAALPILISLADGNKDLPSRIPTVAYIIADAMLAERDKGAK